MVDVSMNLDRINTAISAIEDGAQEYRIGSRLVRRADLKVLYEERRRLQSEISSQLYGGTTVAVMGRR